MKSKPKPKKSKKLPLDGMKTPATIKEFEGLVSKLDKAYGMTKVNLVHESGNEGIWVVPVNEESKNILAGTADGFAFVRLANMPLGWNGLTWGGLVKARVSGQYRPTATVADQTDECLKTDKLVLNAYIATLRKREAEKK